MKKRISRSRWPKLIKQIQSHPSGVIRGCQSVGVRESEYYYWRKKLERAVGEVPSFQEVTVVQPRNCTEVEIRLRNGRSVLLRGEVSITQLSLLVSTVEGA